MAKLIMIKPSSGDSEASIFSGTESSDTVLKTVPAGTILKVIGDNGKYYTVEYDNGLPNVTRGGTAMTGTVVAYPYASLYDDVLKTNKLSNVNNGTGCEILDDTNPSMILIEAITTEGKMSGYIEAKYLYRDKEAPAMFRMTRSATPLNDTESSTGVVTANSGLKARGAASLSGQYIGAFNYGATLTIHETKNGWHRVTGTSGWGDLTDVWVSATYVRVDSSNSSGEVSKTDATEVETESEWDIATAYWMSNSGYTENDRYYKQLSEKYAYALGAPAKYNKTIDVQYNAEITPGAGRVMSKTILSNPAILSICPGTVKMFPNLIGSEKDSILDAMLAASGGKPGDSLYEKIKNDEPAKFSGKLYEFKADTANYATYLNALCRAVSLMLGIGDELMPETSCKLKHFDYAYWTIRKKYNTTAAKANDKDNSIFRNFWTGLVNTGKRLVTTAVDDTTYINFFLTSNETSVSESITASISDSPLSSVLGTVSSAAAMINYFTGSGFDTADANVEDALNAVYNSADSTLGGIATLGKNLLSGGKMVLPKMVEGSTYSKSINCSLKFVSPYGNKYAVFLNCLVPICHLLAMALPKQISDNMYTYPFLIRCAQLGNFNVDLGIITNLTITRGGSDETSYSVDTVATEWDVQMEITPLVDELMVTSTNNPVLFCKNEMLLDYLANFCGFDMLAYNLDTKVQMMLSAVTNTVLDFPHSIENRISDKLYNKINKFFTL